ncbi:TonB-dependent receptor [Flavobacterium antarcticum]|uniref:TonB-dependent receptor n=1 Tax=Flavobacterium antarcticum TaxID=271155 RepID=UPI0003B2FD3A|nr:TonB-dependent receptor [Flavobacterium antarcticum]
MKKLPNLIRFEQPFLKFDLKMKLTVLFLLTSITFIHANESFGQLNKLSIHAHQLTTADVLDKIENTTGYMFVYNVKSVDLQRVISINLEEEKIENVLNKLFVNTTTDYKISGSHIILSVKKATVTPISIAEAEDIEVIIRGKVMNEFGDPLQQASIKVKGTNLAVFSDADGNFAITLPTTDAVLVISYVGFETQEVIVGNTDFMNVKLKFQVENMQEIVIIGYDKQSRNKVTGAVSSIDKKEITQLSVGNVGFDKALGGLAPGVQVSQNSGRPGEPVRLNIRGLTSPLSGSLNQPLFVIDGVPFNADALGGSNPLLALSPNDIEKIDILKDAAATAIYGSRGANGVVIVSTKRGTKNQKSTVDFSYTTTYAQPINTLKALDATQYRAFYDTLMSNSVNSLNDGTLDFFYDMDLMNIGNIELDYDTFLYTYNGLNDSYFGTANTNWNKETFRKFALTNQYNLNVRGGSESTNYSFGLSAVDQEGLVINEKYDQYNLRMAIDSKIGKKVTMGATANVSHTKNLSGEAKDFGFNTVNTANVIARPDLPVRGENGMLLDQPDYQYGFETYEPNPVAKLQNKSENRSYNFIGNTFLEAKVAKDLVLRGDVNAGVFYNDSNLFIPKTTSTNFGYPNESNLITGNGLTSNITTNLTAKYDLYLGDHNFKALVGYSWDRTKRQYNSVFYTGFPDDEILIDPNSAAQITSFSSSKSESGINSIFSRLSYSYNDLYNLTVNFRRDESSKFGPGNKSGYFPSLAASWNIANEEFIKVEDLNVLKLRASYGKVGSANTADFAYLQFFGTNSGIKYGGNTGITPLNILPNKNIGWETTKEFNLGVDFKAFSHRLYGSIDAYSRKTTGALAPTPIPFELGPLTYFSNLMDVSNKGIEINIGGDIIRTEDFMWSMNVNWATNKNKLDKLNGANINQYSLDYYVEGQPIGTIKGYQVEKIFQDQAEIDQLNADAPNGFYSSPSLSVGDYKFKDVNGDGEINADDRSVIGSIQPEFFGGFSNTFTYKNLSLSAFFQYSVGAESVWDAIPTGVYNSIGQNKLAEYGLNTWTPENTDARYAKAVYTDPAGNGRISDRYLFDTSYLRLKNIQLNYTFDKAIVEKLMLSRATIFVAATNIVTWTKWPGIDPEIFSERGGVTDQVQNEDPYPLAKSFSFGVQLQF